MPSSKTDLKFSLPGPTPHQINTSANDIVDVLRDLVNAVKELQDLSLGFDARLEDLEDEIYRD